MDNTNAQQNKLFNVTQIYKDYTAQQWDAKETFYQNQLLAIVVPQGPSPADISNCALRIDALLSMARIEHSYIKQKYDKYDLQLKIEKEMAFINLKTNTPVQYHTLRLTSDETKAIVVNQLANTEYNKTSKTIYQLLSLQAQRLVFIEGIIKALSDKKDLLITHTSMIKIENSMSILNASDANDKSPW